MLLVINVLAIETFPRCRINPTTLKFSLESLIFNRLTILKSAPVV